MAHDVISTSALGENMRVTSQNKDIGVKPDACNIPVREWQDECRTSFPLSVSHLNSQDAKCTFRNVQHIQIQEEKMSMVYAMVYGVHRKMWSYRVYLFGSFWVEDLSNYQRAVNTQCVRTSAKSLHFCWHQLLELKSGEWGKEGKMKAEERERKREKKVTWNMTNMGTVCLHHMLTCIGFHDKMIQQHKTSLKCESVLF